MKFPQKPYFDHKSDDVVGLSDNSNEAGKSSLAFMLSRVFSQYMDALPIMATKCLKAENLFDTVKRMVIDLDEIGIYVLPIIANNNAIIKKKSTTMFCSPRKLSNVYLHTVIMSRPLFFLLDSILILKCNRNNWLGQNDTNKCMLFPKYCHNGNHESDSILSASFCTLQKLHTQESQLILKCCYELTSKSHSPTNLERQKCYFSSANF